MVHPLARALDHAAALEDLGEAAVSRSLPIEQRFHRDLGQEAAGALDRESGGCVADEDVAAQQVIAVADGVQDRLADRAFGERWQLPDEEPGLERLARITARLVDMLPEGLMPAEEPFLELQTELSRPGGGGVAELIH